MLLQGFGLFRGLSRTQCLVPQDQFASPAVGSGIHEDPEVTFDGELRPGIKLQVGIEDLIRVFSQSFSVELERKKFFPASRLDGDHAETFRSFRVVVEVNVYPVPVAHFELRLDARRRTVSPASCIFLPRSSSSATFAISPSNPNVISTCI